MQHDKFGGSAEVMRNGQEYIFSLSTYVAPSACKLSIRSALTAKLRAVVTSLDHAKHQVRSEAAQYTAETVRDLSDPRPLCAATCRKRASNNWHCYSTQCVWHPCECRCKPGKHFESISEYRSSSWARSNFHRDFVRLGKFHISGLSGERCRHRRPCAGEVPNFL